MPGGNLPFLHIERCNIILTVLPFNLASAFWASECASCVPLCVKMLKEGLELAATIYAVTMKLVAQVNCGLPVVTPTKEKKVKKSMFVDPIPCKSKGSFSEDKPDKKQNCKSSASIVPSGTRTPCTPII